MTMSKSSAFRQQCFHIFFYVTFCSLLLSTKYLVIPVSVNAFTPSITTLKTYKNKLHDKKRYQDFQSIPLLLLSQSLPTTQIRTKSNVVLYMNWFSDTFTMKSSSSSSPNGKSGIKDENIIILDKIGSGSYGIVHYCKLDKETNDDNSYYVAKRAWTFDELNHMIRGENAKELNKEEQKQLHDKVKRCNYYLNVEQHCFNKIKTNDINKNSQTSRLPQFMGRYKDSDDQHEWLVFELIESLVPTMNSRNDKDINGQSHPRAAKSLNHAMFLDWKDQHNAGNEEHHHLFMIEKELGMHSNDKVITFEDTLDVMMKSLLEALVEIHKHNIVHRDIKPDNLLIDTKTKSLVLIDLGSAADMDPSESFGSFGKRVGLDDTIVAVSPIYAAPETFVKLGSEALTFDVFSAGLIFCQLLFNLLDERTEAAFRQRLDEANFDLDMWLEREIQSTIRPAGFDDGILYLAERVGVWRLLKDMLVPNPRNRISSFDALKRYKEIITIQESQKVLSRVDIDGEFFDSVASSLELCTIPLTNEPIVKEATTTASFSQQPFVLPRPLHFVATFERGQSLGLILSEVDTSNDDNNNEEFKQTQQLWEDSTRSAKKGEVFVRHLIKDGQADQMGIIEIGDRVVGVGEFPFFNSGFEDFLHMLDKVPRRSKNIKIHFDRVSKVAKDRSQSSTAIKRSSVKVSSQGAWSTKGRRKVNEDTFILQEIHDNENHSVLVAGVFDGHGGDAASKTASQLLPNFLSLQLESENLAQALSSAWILTCDTYQEGCSIHGECVAEYDPREGVLLAGTGSKDLVAGTTAAIGALCYDRNEIIILNCGDSRTLIVGEPTMSTSLTSSSVHFVTQDHSPSCAIEAERLRQGIKEGLDYSEPQCSVNKWWLKVGDYQYAVSRSLEGTMATSKGIVANADITSLNLQKIQEERSNTMMIVASDGIFEVLDNEFVARKALQMRKDGLMAKDTAKHLCSLALEKSTSDNVSVVVVYFE